MNNDHPDFEEFHKSVTNELYSVKDRIRYLVRHWPTDGEWKEVELRSVLRRHLPSSVIIGRGFIVKENASSTQIDILIIDAAKPTLFKEGDLFIVTPDAVLGIVEVKTRLDDKKDIIKALGKLSDNQNFCSPRRIPVWTGLFIFDDNQSVQWDEINKKMKIYMSVYFLQ